MLVFIFASLAVAGQEGRPLRVRAMARQGSAFVGEAIEVQVSTIAGREAPEAVPPRVAGADVEPIDAGPILRQLGTDAIGDVVNETNLYTFRYRLIPRRTGALTVPPVVVRQGDRSGRSEPLRLTVRDLPAAGRPATFLGGVGPLQVEAVAEPTSLRVGETLNHEFRLTGPGARGSTREPDLGALGRLPLGIEVERLAVDEVADPPSRIFRYRLRPTRPGEATLPPVAVSYFDPKSQRYLTRSAQGIPLRVVDVPRFDPRSLDYAPGPEPLTLGGWLSRSPWAALVAAALLAPGLLVGYRLARRLRLARLADPARLLRRAADRLDPGLGAEVLALIITDELACYLNRTTGRPEGVLTPVEARTELEALTADPALANRAARLLSACDRARFAANARDDAEGLAAEARDLFRTLGKLEMPGREVNEGKRRKNRGRHSALPAMGRRTMPPRANTGTDPTGSDNRQETDVIETDA